jgi:hypothetical protein
MKKNLMHRKNNFQEIIYPLILFFLHIDTFGLKIIK